MNKSELIEQLNKAGLSPVSVRDIVYVYIDQSSPLSSGWGGVLTELLLEFQFDPDDVLSGFKIEKRFVGP